VTGDRCPGTRSAADGRVLPYQPGTDGVSVPTVSKVLMGVPGCRTRPGRASRS
jgi:hypothetical protein